MFAAADPADKAAFEKVCGSCHTSAMVTDFLTREEWDETIEHMITNGAKGTKDQFVRLRRYLSQNMTRVNVNKADAAELAPVLGIDETAAQRVVEYRAAHGNFEGLDDLGKAPGMSAALLQPRKEKSLSGKNI